MYFAPEAQAAYGEFGLDHGSGYFCSRGGCMGQVPGEGRPPTRGWSTEQVGAAVVSLEERGLMADGAFTAEGERLRTEIEDATDDGERKLVAALGSDADELFGIIEPWGEAVQAAGGYPADPRTMTRY